MNEEDLMNPDTGLTDEERLALQASIEANEAEQRELQKQIAANEAEASAQQQIESGTQELIQTPQGMVEYGGEMYPAEDIEYETNLFGQQVPFLKRDVAREEIRESAKSGERQAEFEEDLAGSSEQVMERLSAPGAGLADFAVDSINLLPGVKAPKVPKFEDEVTQSIREISSVVLPTMALGGLGVARLGTAAAGVKGARASKLLNDPFVKWAGSALFNAGTGAAVDYTVEFNQTDDNLTGFLKKSYPRTMGWIPDNVATLDTDSPDVKRGKNVMEGAYLGIAMDFLQGFQRLFGGIDSTHKTLKWIPENEKAKAWFDRNVVIDETPEDVVTRSAAKRSEELDEVGGYNFDKSVNPNEPVFGYHDMYGYQESGIRSVDDLGVVGASIDVVRIAKNYNSSYGRVGSVMSEGALRFANESGENGDLIIKGLASTLQDAGKYSYEYAPGKYATFDEVKEVGEKLASDFYEMDLQQLQRTITPGSRYKGVKLQGENVSTGTPELTDEAYSGVMGAIKKYMDDFVNMDEARARAYVGTSVAGQISDTAQGMRLTEGSGSLQRAQEQILDRVEFLMSQKGMTSYVRGRSLNMLNLWGRMTQKGTAAFDNAARKRIENLIKGEKNPTLAAMQRIANESKETVDGLRAIKDANPEMLTPLMMAYELTDGHVKTIGSLNNYIKQSTSVWSKAFFDGQAEIPSVINRAFYANVYNNTLSAFSTPIKAIISGGHLMVEKPVRQFAGAMGRGDGKRIRRAMYQYSGAIDSIRRSFGYANQIFKRSAVDQNVIAVRDDLGLRNKKQLEVLTAFSDAKAAKGDFGAQVLMEQINAMNDLADHPGLRFGTRSMQAMDGFVQSMIADFEAKGKAFDRVTKGGTGEFNAKAAESHYKEAHSKMFDEDGIITDKAVQYAAGEISMNLDNSFNDDLSMLIRRMPILKPFLLFTKTPLNELALTASYSPLGVFMKDMNAFKLPFEEMETEKVMDLLTSRGVDVSDPFEVRGKYEEIRADLKGRKAIGALTTMSAVGLMLDDRLHGNGHYNRQVQKTRREAKWKPRSIKGLDGKWYSYDGLGPVTNYLALIADIGDNMDVLAPNSVGELFKRAMFVFAASFTDKTTLAGLEPFLDVVRGDVGAINRWSSSFISAAAVPGSSQMAEIARLMDPGMKEINNDLTSMIINRMPFLKSTLPTKYDWIDGGEVNVPDNFFARLRNTYTPWKESGKISPEKQFLIDIEYDAVPTLQTDGRGVKLTNEQRSELLDIIGKNELFKRRIQQAMQSISGKEFRSRFKEARADGTSPDTGDFLNIHRTLDKHLRDAIQDAIVSSRFKTTIQRKQEIQKRSQQYMRRGDTEGHKEYLEYVKKNFGI